MTAKKQVVTTGKASKASTGKKVLIAGAALKGGHNRVVGSPRQAFIKHLQRFTSAVAMPLDTVSRAKTAVLKSDSSGKCNPLGHTDNGYATSIIDAYLLGVVSGTVDVVDAKTLIERVAFSPVVFSKCREAKNGPVVATYDKAISHLAWCNPKRVWLNKAYNKATYSTAELNNLADAFRPLCMALRESLMRSRKAYKGAVAHGKVKAVTAE